MHLCTTLPNRLLSAPMFILRNYQDINHKLNRIFLTPLKLPVTTMGSFVKRPILPTWLGVLWFVSLFSIGYADFLPAISTIDPDDVNGLTSVALSRDNLVIGVQGGYDSKAFIYAKEGSGWKEQANFTGRAWGEEVAIEEDTMVLGTGAGIGILYIFTRNTSGWHQQTSFKSSFLGQSVDISGDTVIARGGKNTFVYAKNASAPEGWIQEARLTTSSATGAMISGCPTRTIAIDKETIVIGDPLGMGEWPGSDNGEVGPVQVFTKNEGVWTLEAQLTPSDGNIPDQFGFSVDISGDTIVIGSRDEDNRYGAVYVYSKDTVDWTLKTKLIPPDLAQGFGRTVAVDESTIVVASEIGTHTKTVGNWTFVVGTFPASCLYVKNEVSGDWDYIGMIPGGTYPSVSNHRLAVLDKNKVVVYQLNKGVPIDVNDGNERISDVSFGDNGTLTIDQGGQTYTTSIPVPSISKVTFDKGTLAIDQGGQTFTTSIPVSDDKITGISYDDTTGTLTIQQSGQKYSTRIISHDQNNNKTVKMSTTTLQASITAFQNPVVLYGVGVKSGFVMVRRGRLVGYSLSLDKKITRGGFDITLTVNGKEVRDSKMTLQRGQSKEVLTLPAPEPVNAGDKVRFTVSLREAPKPKKNAAGLVLLLEQ